MKPAQIAALRYVIRNLVVNSAHTSGLTREQAISKLAIIHAMAERLRELAE